MLCAVVILSLVLCSQARDLNLEFETIAAVPLPLSSGSDTRIIGGSPTTIETYPYTVQILYNGQLSCGGSLITKRHVLSAGHCFIDTNGNVASPTLFSIRSGSSVLYSGGSIHSVSMIIVHERYNVPIRDNDIAVLVLSSPVTLSASVAQARIPVQWAEVPDNSSVIHVGWGRTNVNVAQASSVLNEVEVRIVNRDVCRTRYEFLESVTGDPFPVTVNMICAGLLDIGGKDACQGDSGGPLIYNNIVVGLTSWGYGCAEPMFPGVSARVSSYTNWINNTVTRYSGGAALAGGGSATLLAAILSLIIVTTYH
ncbi:trypsin CFT-1-like [Bombyx mandarina]|uniref:Trypsin CFT-1-like n=1 Tax=Bombyx mandarina TaxID=7092 RepID=A0A6J2J8I3_BOMMA|nr:trypsin CFT-1-like [Bombyx mandarina]